MGKPRVIGKSPGNLEKILRNYLCSLGITGLHLKLLQIVMDLINMHEDLVVFPTVGPSCHNQST